jgi:hypothetical protein
MPEDTKLKAGCALRTAGSASTSLGFFILGAALFTVIFMCLRWLRFRALPDWSPVALGFKPPVTGFLALNRLVDWCYGLQLAALLIGFGFALLLVGAWMRRSWPRL